MKSNLIDEEELKYGEPTMEIDWDMDDVVTLSGAESGGDMDEGDFDDMFG